MNRKQGTRRPQEIYRGLWVDELNDGQAPLVASELLGALVERLLVQHLVDDGVEVGRFLRTSSLDSKVRLSYLLGLISREEAGDLRILDAIRQEFAVHLGERTFEDEGVRALVDRLETARQFAQHPASAGAGRDPRSRFNAAVHILARYLKYRAQDRAAAGRRPAAPGFRYSPPGEPPLLGG